VPAAAPRIDERLLEALRRFDDREVPIAETNRRLGELALLLGFPKPSYEQVRLHVHELRAEPETPSLGRLLLDVEFRLRPPSDFIDALYEREPPLKGRRSESK